MRRKHLLPFLIFALFFFFSVSGKIHKTTGWRHQARSPSPWVFYEVFCTWQDWLKLQVGQTWAAVTLCDPANGTGCTGGIITLLEFHRSKKTIHCCIDLFHQFTLARVSRAARRQGQPWQCLNRAINTHSRRSGKGNSCWTKPKACITSLQRSHKPQNELLWLWQIPPQMPSVKSSEHAV